MIVLIQTIAPHLYSAGLNAFEAKRTNAIKTQNI